MPIRDTALRDAFMEDHRHLTTGLSRLLKALKLNDPPKAVEIADELDRVAGPHMAFEEEVFYPELEKRFGQEFVSRLYGEHELGQTAVRTLVTQRPVDPLEPTDQLSLIEEVETALNHALSCGSLLSHITTLSVAEREELLTRLQAFREEAPRWTDLPSRGTEPSS